jgi:4-diphosphocytidyl-2-C-methyl-D-erythritol kinase
MLQQAKGVLEGVQIELKKNIPVGAGLGGGSSDAAATLLGLLQLWNVSISEEELYGIAQQIGSDVPYFLKEGTAYATGRGELLEYFDSSLPYWIVVVYPNIKVSTAWVYQNVQYKSQISKPGTQTSLKKFLIENIHTPYMLTHLLQNDLEPIVFRMHPKVTQVKKTLYKSGAVFVQMSGSGSSVYGLFTTEQLAKTTSEKFPHNYNVFLTPPSFKPR